MIANNSYDSFPLFTILFGLKINKVGDTMNYKLNLKNIYLNYKKIEIY